jgi:hypothetical protein
MPHYASHANQVTTALDKSLADRIVDRSHDDGNGASCLFQRRRRRSATRLDMLAKDINRGESILDRKLRDAIARAYLKSIRRYHDGGQPILRQRHEGCSEAFRLRRRVWTEWSQRIFRWANRRRLTAKMHLSALARGYPPSPDPERLCCYQPTSEGGVAMADRHEAKSRNRH